MDGGRSSLKRFAPRLVLVVVLLGAVFIAMDWGQVRNALGQARLQPIPYALAATLISYGCISFSFARVSKLLGIRMRVRDLAAVGFVSTVINHLVSSGGAAGYSVRYLLMNRHGVGMKDVLAASILHFYLTSLMMIAMLPVGLIYLLLHASASQTASIILGALASIVVLAALFATGLVFSGSMRERVIAVLVRAARALAHRDVEGPLARFDATMTQGVQAMRERPSSLVLVLSLIATDWAASAIALWFCFRALGATLAPGQLVSGFVIGIVAGVASMIPGGLGVQEGSMAGIFALLGVSFERALLASILFRLVYLMIPYAVSLGFYWRLLRREAESQTASG